jgi:hypothetical protein
MLQVDPEDYSQVVCKLQVRCVLLDGVLQQLLLCALGRLFMWTAL